MEMLRSSSERFDDATSRKVQVAGAVGAAWDGTTCTWRRMAEYFLATVELALGGVVGGWGGGLG